MTACDAYSGHCPTPAPTLSATSAPGRVVLPHTGPTGGDLVACALVGGALVATGLVLSLRQYGPKR